jgi:hypothetical protein
MGATRAAVTSSLGSGAGIRDDTRCNESIPDEQNDDGSDGCADEPGALIGPVPADHLAEKCRQEGSADAKHGGENETRWIIRPW